MLVKLFKYEWKAFWKVPATINLALLIVTLVGMATLVTPFWEIDSFAIEMLSVTAIMFYIVGIFDIDSVDLAFLERGAAARTKIISCNTMLRIFF